jgi:hypothetical protein
MRHAASEEQRAPSILKDSDGLLDPVSQQTERLLDLLRRQPEVASDLPQFPLGNDPANAGERQSQQVEYGDLGNEGFG